MNAKRKHLIRKVMKADPDLVYKDEDKAFDQYKEHLLQFTDEEIEQELATIHNIVQE